MSKETGGDHPKGTPAPIAVKGPPSSGFGFAEAGDPSSTFGESIVRTESGRFAGFSHPKEGADARR